MKNKGYILLYETGFSLLIAILFKLSFFRFNEFWDLDLFNIIVGVFIILEGNLLINNRLDTKYRWIENPQKRLLIQSIACILFTTMIFFIFTFIIHQIKFGDGRLINRKMIETFAPALFFTFAVLAGYISNQFYKALKQSLIDVEKYKTASANAQLQILQNQLNPHFLFNNLSVLTSLIYQNQDKAADFINELSKVYRYVLDNKSSELVSLQEELNFLDHYIYLLKIRFDSSISFVMDIDETTKDLLLPPMCLQMLVENTFQHNEASQAKPLQISIYTNRESITIENPVQQRNDAAESSKTGLKNIQLRYSYLTDKNVEIINNGNYFKVVLPLIGVE